MEKFLWDSQLSVFTLRGEDSRKFLHGQTTADIINAKEGSLFHSCWLNPVGNLKALLEIEISNETVSFILLAGDTKEVLDGLEKVIFISDKVEIFISHQIRRVQVISFDKSWKSTKPKWISLDDSYSQEYDKYKILNKENIMEWKIRQGFPSSLYELDGKINPLELGLTDLIDFSKGCFLGQETIAKVNNIGKLKYKLKFFMSDTLIDPGQAILAKIDNFNRVEKVGIATSAMPIDDLFIGLALIRNKFLSLDEIQLTDSIGKLKLSTPIGFNSI